MGDVGELAPPSDVLGGVAFDSGSAGPGTEGGGARGGVGAGGTSI